MLHHRKLIAQCLGVVLALPLLYVASSGPMLRLSARNPTGERSACTFYEPLFHVTTHPGLGRPMSAYLRLWHVTPVDFGDQTSQWFISLRGREIFVRHRLGICVLLAGFTEPGYSYRLRHVRTSSHSRTSCSLFLNLH